MVYLARIYTKSGDRGETSLVDGTRVPKDDDRVESYGEIDELNAVLGIVVTLPDFPETKLIRSIQNDLFDAGADLGTPYLENEQPGQALRITEAQVSRLEREIDRLNGSLEPLKSFILPGGSPASAYLHLARTVCRRAERRVVTLLRQGGMNPFAFQYLNRLSDLLFVLSRSTNDGGKKDVLWVPGQSREV